jgi:hypothetical protein
MRVGSFGMVRMNRERRQISWIRRIVLAIFVWYLICDLNWAKSEYDQWQVLAVGNEAIEIVLKV